ncbi:MAG: hypothetical protein H0Z35_09150 [Thermoanaerobacteraceae bacterium]|nr:hypothetical protein [Thermoanaerobacteraceae bacterium]
MARNPNKKRCKARSKRTGKQCKNWAKPGWDVCHYHGAGGGAPKGNKNAVTTGEYETIWLDTLDDEERVLFDKIKTDVLKQLDEEIKLMTIRERRMMQRIQRLRQADFTVVKIKQGTEKGRKTDIQESEGTLGQIQAIEEALTRVQEKKAKLLDLKHKIETGADKDDGSLAELAQAIRESKLRAGDG